MSFIKDIICGDWMKEEREHDDFKYYIGRNNHVK